MPKIKKGEAYEKRTFIRFVDVGNGAFSVHFILMLS